MFNCASLFGTPQKRRVLSGAVLTGAGLAAVFTAIRFDPDSPVRPGLGIPGFITFLGGFALCAQGGIEIIYGLFNRSERENQRRLLPDAAGVDVEAATPAL